MTTTTTPPAIKICGIQTKEVYEQLQELYVDYVGFVFAKSKRQVTAEQVANITQANLHPSSKESKTPQHVGVFVNESLEEMVRIARVAGLYVLQLHGDETPAACQALRDQGFHVWKAFGVRGDERDEALAAYQGTVDAVLLDNERGGTGVRFPWSAIEKIRVYVPGVPLFVAGGLSVDNVGELLANYSPDGVDVSSGVETDGSKDSAKITAFIKKAREKK